ncbi:stealth conserved region 3 domain-containing protein [Oceanicola sp. 22II-s10i]|uniref:stealth conserved region 3 domain-containing protein n=1 Tax=Oceanicola sp. 22II-s10i TaxID=1317116 RepID=UPI001594FA54|nr:stealth conserved region 3 domain-containing protein [Oceanicola sp. 22II-s10i]
MTGQERIDVVYTWVDDTFDGYAETLAKYVDKPADTNPNRTRDNLDMLRYSLRSLSMMPELGHVHILSCRPQVPRWLNTEAPGITVHHHDAVMDAELLPTFNSFAIVSHLHLLPGLSDRFVYFEDDMLIANPGMIAGLTDPDGRSVSHFLPKVVPGHDALKPTDSPWNHALATAVEVLNRTYKRRPRNPFIHGPQVIDRARYGEMIEKFAPEIERTRRSRFRSNDNVPPEYLYPQVAVEEGWARRATKEQAAKMEGYVSIENFLPLTWLMMRLNEGRKPTTYTFNDSFGKNPNPRVVHYVRQWLEERYPEPSPWEKPARAHVYSSV